MRIDIYFATHKKTHFQSQSLLSLLVYCFRKGLINFGRVIRKLWAHCSLQIYNYTFKYQCIKQIVHPRILFSQGNILNNSYLIWLFHLFKRRIFQTSKSFKKSTQCSLFSYSIKLVYKEQYDILYKGQKKKLC